VRIERMEIFHLALPMRRPIRTPLGPTETLETVVVRMEGAGASGWGEASPGNGPWASPEWARSVFDCLRDWLAPRLAGQSIDSGEELERLLSPFRGNHHARAALDAAWWDLNARLQHRPLHQLLGGTRQAIEVGVSFDEMETIEALLEAIDAAFQAGYGRVEVKMRPGWDLQMLNEVRHQFPTQTIHADVEAALTLNHMEILYRLDDFSLAMVEQPLPADDLVGHAMVQEVIRTPLCLDEGIATVQQADMAMDLKSCQYVNIKPGRVGGLTPATAIHDVCQQHNVPCFVGAMPQSAIGSRIGWALAAKANFSYPSEYVDSAELLGDDLAEPIRPVRDGEQDTLKIRLWQGPGIGVEPDVAALSRVALRKVSVP